MGENAITANLNIPFPGAGMSGLQSLEENDSYSFESTWKKFENSQIIATGLFQGDLLKETISINLSMTPHTKNL